MILHIFLGIELKEFVGILSLCKQDSEFRICGRSLHIVALVEERLMLVQILLYLLIGHRSTHRIALRIGVLACKELDLESASDIRLIDALVSVESRHRLVAFLCGLLDVVDSLVYELLVGIGESHTLRIGCLARGKVCLDICLDGA